MKQVIIGYGNTLRGDDAFGVDVVTLLQNKALKKSATIKAFQLTPEIALELLEYSHIIFIDTAFSPSHEYALACSLEKNHTLEFSHHISAFHLIDILSTLYQHFPTFEIFSMLGNHFESINDSIAYTKALQQTVDFLSQESTEDSEDSF